ELLEHLQKAIKTSTADKLKNHADDFVKRLELLTPRENEVLELVVSGKLNKQIASILGITSSTVELHRANLMRKLRVKTIADLIRSYLLAKGYFKAPTLL
ncbi:MAG: response regulator transcription factor, partial [Candidatus Paceibacterales bacterium]